jgi:hypothetical protein
MCIWTHVLVNVLLARVEGRLPHLQAQLRRGVVDEAPERRVLAEAAALLLGHAAALGAVAIAALWLRGRLRGRRGSQLGDRRDVLWDGVVDWKQLGTVLEGHAPDHSTSPMQACRGRTRW